MKNLYILTFIALMSVSSPNIFAQEKDTYPTAKGDLVIHFLGHGSLRFEFNNMNIYIDPFSKVANYTNMPKANLILVTHSHGDHLDTSAISKINTKGTQMIYTQECANTGKYSGATIIMKNGDKQTFEGIGIEAVPAYNIVHQRPNGQPFHPKGEGNGYVLTLGDKKIYIGGDTENIPEMKDLKDIDIAFIPMNLPYTMTPEEMADAARLVRPKVLYPYHFGETDVTKLLELLKDTKEIEIKVRAMK